MWGMSLQTNEAMEKAQLLAANLGIHLPAAMTNLIVRSEALQVALEAAFSSGILLGIIAGLGRISGKFLDITAEGRGLGEALQSALKPISRYFEDILLAMAKIVTFIPLIGGGEEARKAVNEVIRARHD